MLKSAVKNKKISGFKSEAGLNKYLDAYKVILDNWPVEYQISEISTRFGTTHVIGCGSWTSPPLLLLPAAGLSSTLWIHNIADLSTHFRVYAIDILGEPGKSKQEKLLRERVDAAEWLIDVLEGLQIKKVNICGISFGGFLSLNFALYAPERVDKLILLAPAASLLKFKLGILVSLKLGGIQWMMPTRMTISSLKLINLQANNRNEFFTKQFGIGIKTFRFPKDSIFPTVYTDEELRSLRTKTLLLIGDKEVIYDPEKALDRAVNLISNVETHLIPNASHLLNIDQPKMINDSIIDFLERSDD
ncbi:MAG: alpha/beta fold hydrolase [Candidatus Hodarchaeales archaeon]|jgi:pimeloyl-ACP methyl ester carboxylesterase